MKIIQQAEKIVDENGSKWKGFQQIRGRNKDNGEFVQDILCGGCYSMFRIEQKDMHNSDFLSKLENDELYCPSCKIKVPNKLVKDAISVTNEFHPNSITQGELNVFNAVKCEVKDCKRFCSSKRYADLFG
jgi:hypothetical protein